MAVFQPLGRVRQRVRPGAFHEQLAEILLNLRAANLEHRRLSADLAAGLLERDHAHQRPFVRQHLDLEARELVAKARIVDQRPAAMGFAARRSP